MTSQNRRRWAVKEKLQVIEEARQTPQSTCLSQPQIHARITVQTRATQENGSFRRHLGVDLTFDKPITASSCDGWVYPTLARQL